MTYPYLVETAMGWPELMLSKRARGTVRKNFSILTGNRCGWRAMVKSVGRGGFLGQTGASPVTHPYLVGMVLASDGWN